MRLLALFLAVGLGSLVSWAIFTFALWDYFPGYWSLDTRVYMLAGAGVFSIIFYWALRGGKP